MVGDSACLGLALLGKCSYDPAAPNQSYFTIGQLISVIALLLAFSQLTKPIIKFRLLANKVNYAAAISASAFAIACVFVATILPFIPGKALPLLGYPVVWEILAGLVFVIVAGKLLWTISRPPSFHFKNADAYLKACATIIAKGNEDELGELAEEISPAVKAVFDECNRYDHQAFMNRESMLMREEDYSGLGFFKEFRDTVFGNWHFVESTYRPLQSWRSYEEQILPWQAEKYSECLKTSLKAYFLAKEYESLPSSVYVGLNRLADLAVAPAFEIRNTNERGALAPRVSNVLHEIANGFEGIIALVEEHHDLLPSYEFEEDHYDRFNDKSIYGVVAYAVYQYFENLAMAKRHDSLIRQYAISIWLDIFGVGTDTSSTANEIGKRLIVHLNKKIHQNLDSGERWYPLVTRLIISLNGIYESQHGDKPDTNLGGNFHKAFLERLKAGFPLLAKVDREFAEELLPEGTTYDPAGNRLIEKRLRQQTVVLKLAATEH